MMSVLVLALLGALATAVDAQSSSLFGDLIKGAATTALSNVHWEVPAYYQCNKNLLSTANATGACERSHVKSRAKA